MNKIKIIDSIEKNYKEKKESIKKIFDINNKYKYKFTFDRNNNKHIIEVYNEKKKNKF